MNIFETKKKNWRKSGMTLFIAVTIMGALLFVSFAVVNITIKSTLFASSGRDSQLAFYAADAGLECALYHDSVPTTSRFDPAAASGGSINCGGLTLTDGTTAIQGTSTATKIGGSGGGSPTNVALGKTATQISTSFGGDASRAVDGNTSGLWSDNSTTHTSGSATDWWQVDLGATYDISSVVVWNRMDCCKPRLTDYYVYISNTPGGTDHTYHPTSFPNPSSSVTTTGASGRYVRIQLSGSASNFDSGGYFLHMAEVQVMGVPSGGGGGGTPTNFALASNGGVASASSEYNASFPAGSINNGDRLGNSWASGGGWNDGTYNSYPDWAQVTFSSPKTIDKIDVYTLANCFGSCTAIDSSTSASTYGISDFQIQYDNGSGWTTVTGGTVTGNSLAWRQFTFSAIDNVTKIRANITGARVDYSRLVELEAWGTVSSGGGGGGGSGNTNTTSTFGFTLNQGENPTNACAIVTVTKNPDGTTYIKSRGYNTCDMSNPRRIERGVEVTY